MIGAMPAVAVRHERRRQEKRSKRPSQLYLGGPWLPPPSPSPTPSPGQNYPEDDRFPEYYVCGKVSALQLVVGSLLLGAIVLVVGLVQLTPGAADADHRWVLLGTGGALISAGLALTAVRCCCMRQEQPQPLPPEDEPQPAPVGIGSPSELAALLPPECDPTLDPTFPSPNPRSPPPIHSPPQPIHAHPTHLHHNAHCNHSTHPTHPHQASHPHQAPNPHHHNHSHQNTHQQALHPHSTTGT